MANLVSTGFRTALLNTYIKGTAAPVSLFLHLFKDEANIIEGSTMASIAPHVQAGTGYGCKTLLPANWTIEPDPQGVRMRLVDQVWVLGADNWSTLRWGVISDKADFTGSILIAKDYGIGRNVFGVGSTVTVDDFSFILQD